MTTPEGWVKHDVKAWLKWLDWWYLMPVKERHGRVGVPDFIICAAGTFLAVETKRPGNEGGVTQRQQDELAGIANCGGSTLVCTSLEQLKDYCYAHQSIREKLPARGSHGEPQAARGAAHAAARTLRI